MNKTTTLTTLLLSALLAAGCAATAPQGDQAAATPEAFEQLLQEATAALDKADAVGFEWRDSRKILNQAKEAAARGDFEQAVELARAAARQGEAAYAQYLAARNAGPRF